VWRAGLKNLQHQGGSWSAVQGPVFCFQPPAALVVAPGAIVVRFMAVELRRIVVIQDVTA
jgi:hypothetical protein